jgi:hypothetical protein
MKYSCFNFVDAMYVANSYTEQSSTLSLDRVVFETKSKKVLVQPYMISDMVIVWKIALENDFIKSKHVLN